MEEFQVELAGGDKVSSPRHMGSGALRHSLSLERHKLFTLMLNKFIENLSEFSTRKVDSLFYVPTYNSMLSQT